jgi:hypothetical protein
MEGDDAVARFTVVLEDIRSQNKVVSESVLGLRETMEAGFAAVDRRFEAVDRRFDAMDARFEAVDRRFDAMDARFERVDARFDRVDARFDRVDGEIAVVKGDLTVVKADLSLVKAAVLENSRDLKDLRVAVTRKVDSDEVEAIVARAVGR